MSLQLLLPLVITAIVAVAGWFIAHRLSADRDRETKRRELRVEYLIDVWRRLENVSARTDDSRNVDLESAVADIQLFGSNRQIELAYQFMEDFVKNGHADLDDLLDDLRRDLRHELKLEASSSTKTKHLRITSDSGSNHKKQ